MRDEAKEGQDFLPLMVDFRENTYSAGKIPGGFFKREGKPSEKEVLLSRLIDRPIRPLFAENYHNDTQVIAMLLSADFSVDYDSMGIIGASAALVSSTIPFSTPLGAVKIGWKKTGEYFVNPGLDVLKELDMVLLVAGTENEVVMLEAGGNEFCDQVFLEGLRRAKEVIARICQAQKELINPDKMVPAAKPETTALAADIRDKFSAQIRDAIFTQDRVLRHLKIKAIMEEIQQGKEDGEEIARIKGAFEKVEAQIFREHAAEGKTAHRQPRLHRDPSHLHRAGSPAPRPRLRRLYPRRNPVAVDRHPGLRGRRPEAGHTERRRVQEKIHAALQFPAVLGGRGQLPPRSRPPRDRPRQPGRKGPEQDHPGQRHASPIPSASFPTSWNRTVPPRWPPSAAARWP